VDETILKKVLKNTAGEFGFSSYSSDGGLLATDFVQDDGQLEGQTDILMDRIDT
jgi:hypothetical protein